MHKYNNYRVKRRIVSDRDALKHAEDTLTVMIDVVKEVENTEISFDKSCRQHGISSQRFTRVLESLNFRTCTDLSIPDSKPHTEKEITDPCTRFYRDFFEDEEFKNLPNDAEESILFILKQLTPQFQQVIRERYGINTGEKPKELAKIGSELGVTRSRIGQICQKAFHKLRTPRNETILLNGIAEYQKECEQREKRNDLLEKQMMPKIGKKNVSDNEELIKELKNISIEDIGFSSRSYNRLKKIGVNNMYDLLRTSDDKILQTKGIGAGSFNEIREKERWFCQINHLQAEGRLKTAEPVRNQTEEKADSMAVLLKNTPIEKLNLAKRSNHVLHDAGINNVNDLLAVSDNDLIKIKHLGRISLNDITEKINNFCLENGLIRNDYIITEKNENVCC